MNALFVLRFQNSIPANDVLDILDEGIAACTIMGAFVPLHEETGGCPGVRFDVREDADVALELFRHHNIEPTIEED